MKTLLIVEVIFWLMSLIFHTVGLFVEYPWDLGRIVTIATAVISLIIMLSISIYSAWRRDYTGFKPIDLSGSFKTVVKIIDVSALVFAVALLVCVIIRFVCSYTNSEMIDFDRVDNLIEGMIYATLAIMFTVNQIRQIVKRENDETAE